MTEDQRWPLASALIGDAKVENLVISNADPHVTFGKLIDREHQSPWTRLRLRHIKYSV